MRKKNILGIGLALILLVIALILLGDIIGYLKTETIFGQYWPVLLILLGILTFGGIGGDGGFSFGIILLGLFLLLKNIGILAGPSGNIILIVLICLTAIAVLALSSSKSSKNNRS